MEVYLCVWEKNGERRGQIASGTLERQMGNILAWAGWTGGQQPTVK